MTSEEPARLRLRQFLLSSLKIPELADDADIFTVGGASSLFAVELVLFVEEDLATPLEDDDLERSNFATIDAVVALVERKRANA